MTQTRVRPESMDAFARWQEETSNTVAQFPGFIKQTVMPPSPPAQADWVILQRFTSTATAVAWLNSEQRLKRIQGAAPMLVGRDDVHIVNDGDAGVLPSPASVVISTRIKPGQELAYRAWEQRIAAAQSKAAGFQGYRFEPPVPGVQDDWLAILRFDTEANLQAWLNSPERQKLLQDANPFTEEFHARIVRTGFDQWFPVPAGGAAPPAVWKMNMLVLLMLYPIVFLFGFFVQTPLPDRPRAAVRNRTVHRQHRERRAAQLSRPADGRTFLLVAAARGRASAADRGRRRGARGCALRRDAPGVLAPVLAFERAAGGPHGQCVSGIPQVTRLRERLVRNAAPAAINAIC